MSVSFSLHNLVTLSPVFVVSSLSENRKCNTKYCAQFPPLLLPGCLSGSDLLLTEPKGSQDALCHHDVAQSVHMATIAGQLILDIALILGFAEHISLSRGVRIITLMSAACAFSIIALMFFW